MRHNEGQRLFLFDLDGTLSAPRTPVINEVLEALRRLKTQVTIGIVSGSDMPKMVSQLGQTDLSNVFEYTDYVFAENGTVARYRGAPLGADLHFPNHIGEEVYKKLVAFVLRYIADLDIPIKRGTFIELRSGMVNISPIGRSCTAAERQEFYRYDQEHGIRETFAKALREAFACSGLEFAIGGQISIDCYPNGWDKRLSLDRIRDVPFSEIRYFGDRTAPGGNDYAIYVDSRVVGHSVTSPEDTLRQLRALGCTV